MKTKLTLICLTVLALVTVSCSDEKYFNPQNPNVEQFVSLVKAGNYGKVTGNEMPDFSMSHVDGLIKHLGDSSIIKEFPANPISSKYTSPKILSECIMWAIEGIRLEKKYPSLEPALVDTSVGRARLNNSQLLEMSAKYIDWYNEYKANPSEALRKKDLLDNTTYKWD